VSAHSIPVLLMYVASGSCLRICNSGTARSTTPVRLRAAFDRFRSHQERPRCLNACPLPMEVTLQPGLCQEYAWIRRDETSLH